MAATITVVCPSCRNEMRASSDHIGKRGRCPSCKALVEIAPSEADSDRRVTSATHRSADAGRRSSDTTDVKSWLAGLIAIATTAVLYLAVFLPTRGMFLGQLFMDRGPIPYIITLFSCWGAALLILKYVAVRKQRGFADLELEFIPLEIGLQVAPENVDQFIDHISDLPDDERQSILGHRIQGALEHFKHRNSVPEVQDYLSSQAELDASGVDSGYTLLRAFIWAIPILGFIGTVMGISEAVTGLKQAMPSGDSTVQNAPADNGADDGAAANAADESIGQKMMQAMGQVTSGLSTAFDTTLLALVMAVLLLFPTESLRKSEYRMLDRIEEFTNESLLRRMSETKKLAGEAPQIVRDALQSAFQEHQRWLAQWQAQVQELGQVIGGEFENAVVNVQDQLVEFQQKQMEEVRGTAEMVRNAFEKFGETATTWESNTEASRRNLEQSLEVSAKLQEAVEANGKLLSQVTDAHAPAAGNGLRDEIKAEFQNLKAELRQTGTPSPTVVATSDSTEIPQVLSPAEPSEVEPEPPKKRGGLFGLFRSK